MKRLSMVALVVLTVLGTGGCNALYFAETEKFSLSVEAKTTDATEPVAGNLGFKQRIVVVTPAKRPTTEGTSAEVGVRPATTQPRAEFDAFDRASTESRQKMADRDALSIASYFDLRKNKGKTVFDQPTIIRSAFFTGEAAKAIAEQEKTAQALKQAVAGTFGPDANSDRIKRWLDDDPSESSGKPRTHHDELDTFIKKKGLKIQFLTDLIYDIDYAGTRADVVKELNIP